MSPQEAIKAGEPEQALRLVRDLVKREPAAVRYRVLLFQLLAVQGEWGKARTQLDVLKDLDAGTLMMTQTYALASRCEVERAEVFAGRRAPQLFGEPQPWMATMIQALQLDADSDYAGAAQLREQALADAPAQAGTIDGEPFAWLADADPRFGPLLEAIINGQYGWMPLVYIRRLTIEAPSDLRDIVWTPAEVTWSNGGQAVALIPTRYPGTEASGDALLRLARKTDWRRLGGHAQFGLGQRLLASDQRDYALLDTRCVEFTAADG